MERRETWEIVAQLSLEDIGQTGLHRHLQHPPTYTDIPGSKKGGSAPSAERAGSP